MSMFQTVWTQWTDDVGADRCATHRVPRSRKAEGRTVAGQRKTDPTMRMVRLHPFEIEMVLRAFDRMKDRAFGAGDMDAAGYFHFQGIEIKNAARIRKARRTA
jgi:hypothetical protein